MVGRGFMTSFKQQLVEASEGAALRDRELVEIAPFIPEPGDRELDPRSMPPGAPMLVMSAEASRFHVKHPSYLRLRGETPQTCDEINDHNFLTEPVLSAVSACLRWRPLGAWRSPTPHTPQPPRR